MAELSSDACGSSETGCGEIVFFTVVEAFNPLDFLLLWPMAGEAEVCVSGSGIAIIGSWTPVETGLLGDIVISVVEGVCP